METRNERPDFSKMTEQELTRYWVENWKRVGPELERIKREELRALSEEDAYEIAEDLQASVAEDIWIDPRRLESSGLVEQQRIFQKACRGRTSRAR